MLHDTRENGYRNVKAHRYAHERYKGPIPAGMSVLHKCDIECCVNPAHLFLGTQADNMQDKKKKGRALRGERVGNSKLKESDVLQILEALDHGDSQYIIAARFNIAQCHVSDIKNGKRWSHLQRKSLN